MGIDLQKAYYYIVCLIAGFVLLWGAIDFTSASASYVSSLIIRAPQSDQNLEEFYQKKVAQDRIFDSLARIIVSGAVFMYCRKKVS